MSLIKKIGLLGVVIAAFVVMVLYPTFALPAFGLAGILGLGFWLNKKHRTIRTKQSWLNHHDIARVLVLLALGAVLYFADPLMRAGFLLFLAMLVALAFLLPLVPGLIQALANEPNAERPSVTLTDSMSRVEKAQALANVGTYKPSTFAIFTFIKPGRIKAIVRGQRFRRFIMRFDGETFHGDTLIGTPMAIGQNQREYWNVEHTPDGQEDSHPIPHSLKKGHLDLMWYWSRYVYNLTGAVFTGFPPFQTVEVYQLEQLTKVISSEAGNQGEFIFVPYNDYSDHVRAGEYQFFVQIPSAETKDQVKVRIQFSLTVMVKNPYKAYYDTDNKWASRLFTAVAQEVSARVRALNYQEVVGAKTNTKSARNPLVAPVFALNPDKPASGRAAEHDIGTIGLYIKGAELLDAEVADPKLAAALADVAKSKADKEARQNRADAETYAVDSIATAARKHGEYGRLALEIEGNVRTAEAATKNGGDVILTVGGRDSKPVDPATVLLKKTIEGGS